MRRGLLPYVLALLLGMSTALLAACGDSSTKSGIPSASAGELKSQITDVAQAVESRRCDEVDGQLRQVDRGIDELPETTDNELVSALRDGADRLRSVAVEECEEDERTETTTTPQDTETTATLPEDTETTEVPPEDTETAETPTPPAAPPPTPPTGGTPPVTPPPPPPATPTPPPPPPVTPGGGVTPEIPPDE